MPECEECGKEFETERGVSVHQGKMHREDTEYDPKTIDEYTEDELRFYWYKYLLLASMYLKSVGDIEEELDRRGADIPESPIDYEEEA